MKRKEEHQLATKKDLLGLRQATKKDLSGLKLANKNDLLELRQANKKDLMELRQENKKDVLELRQEMATKKDFLFLYTKILEHDERFDRIDGKLDKTIHIMQQMCDKVLKRYENFSVESVAIKDNYQRLEGRVTKVESVVFPVV